MQGTDQKNFSWKEEIPDSWDIVKTKYYTYMKGRIGWQGLTANEFIEEGPYLVTGTDFENGHVCWERSYHISEQRYAQAPEIQLKVGDLLVTKDGTIGKLAYIDKLPGEASLNSHLLVMRPLREKYINKYLFWVLNSRIFIDYYTLVSYGSTMDSLTQEKMGEFSFPAPPLSEQMLIADYLDERCKKLDSIISDLEKQIETLKAYKKSLITETVTKGLDRNVPMKDSGISWIGQIPKHWDTNRLKYLGSARNGLTYDPADICEDEKKEGITLVLRSSNIQNDKLSLEDTVYVDMRIPEVIRLKKDDILLCSRNGSRDLIGKCIIIDEQMVGETYGAFMCVFRSPYNKFIHYVFLSDIFSYYLGTFLTSTVNQLTNQNLYNMLIPITYDIDEQNRIVEFLDAECLKLDTTIDIKLQQLDKMKQHKQSLIFEYVTGKKRVKEAQ